MLDSSTVAPLPHSSSGALGWIDTFVLPAKGQADDAAYAWINFVMQPEIAAKITAAAGNFTASAGADEFAEDSLKAKYQASFPPEAVDNIKWYPPVPAGLEAIEGEVLDRVQAAN
jgi:spermidine/putrescine transport system substrate-binding protein